MSPRSEFSLDHPTHFAATRVDWLFSLHQLQVGAQIYLNLVLILFKMCEKKVHVAMYDEPIDDMDFRPDFLQRAWRTRGLESTP